MPKLTTNTTENKKCGMIALLGAPNAGKSTLINQLVGSKIAIVTPKVQTTRQMLRGIQMLGNTQLIYIDTPGIFAAPEAYEKAMVATAWTAAGDADVLLVIVDASQGLTAPLEGILKKLSHQTKPKALVLNKIDKMPKPKLLALATWLNQQVKFDETFMISALKGDGIEALQNWLETKMPPQEWLFPDDQLSDMPIRFLAAEITRERLFLRLREELPYGLMVQTEAFEEKADGSVKINQVIIVQRETHKKILIGTKGELLKTIGQSARHEIGKLLDCKVHLFLFVKVVPDWKERGEYRNTNQLPTIELEE
jgi:GTP-binding protein Era